MKILVLYFLKVISKHCFPITIERLGHDMLNSGILLFHVGCHIVIFTIHRVLQSFKEKNLEWLQHVISVTCFDWLHELHISWQLIVAITTHDVVSQYVRIWVTKFNISRTIFLYAFQYIFMQSAEDLSKSIARHIAHDTSCQIVFNQINHLEYLVFWKTVGRGISQKLYKEYISHICFYITDVAHLLWKFCRR